VGSLRSAGIELSFRESGSGPALVCLHETAACAAVWAPLEAALEGRRRLIAPDRRGWGDSEAPQPYDRTTVAEQAHDAAELIEARAGGAATVCGSGLGAVAALDLALRRPELLDRAVLIEPPLLAFFAEATEGLSADRAALTDAVSAGGPDAAMELYLSGGLPFAGAGAGRIPGPVAEVARRTPLTLFAELAAVPNWPLRSSELRGAETETTIVTSSSTPAILRSAAAELAERLTATRLVDLRGEGLPHAGAATELAAVLTAD